MPKGIALPSILTASVALLAAHAASAQDIEPVSVELIEGVAFVGQGGVERVEGADGTPVATFWRPLQYERDEKQLAGRMECLTAAKREPYRAVLYELENVHDAQVAQGRLDGFTEVDRREERGDVVNRLDVSGRRSSPRRYQVLTYLAVRTGADLVSIRRTCSFLRDGNIYRQDFIPFVDRYTSIVLALPPPDTQNPFTAPTLDSLTDLNS